MDERITIERFNALPMNEQVGYLFKAGKPVRSDTDDPLYDLFAFRVRVHITWKPIRITKVTAFDPRTQGSPV